MTDYRIIPLDEVTSTNDVAMEESEYGHGTLLTARRQTAGRGQRGNRWESPAGENLMFSLVLEPGHIPVEQQFRISEMAALAASDAIRSVTREAVWCQVKWPNDLYVQECKIGGILIEHAFHSPFLARSVIGIGINVRQREFDPSLPNPTSIALRTDRCPEPEEVLDTFCLAFSRRYEQNPDSLHADYTGRLWRGEGYHLYRDKEGEFEARIAAIDPHTGELTLEDRRGKVRSYWFKEVEAVL